MRRTLAVLAAAALLASCKESAPPAPPPPYAWRVTLGEVAARYQDGHVIVSGAGAREGWPADPDTATRLQDLVLNSDWNALAARAPEGNEPALTVEIGRRKWTLSASGQPRVAALTALLDSTRQ